MGPLTEDFTRLCSEILAGREARQTFLQGLNLEVAALRAAFRQDHRDMAQATETDRKAWVQGLTREVAGMRAEFRRALTRMGQQTRESRAGAILDLKATVAGLRHGFAADLQGAHRVWVGPSPAELRAQAEAARLAAAEAERQRAQAEAQAKIRESEAQARAGEKAPSEPASEAKGESGAGKKRSDPKRPRSN